MAAITIGQLALGKKAAAGPLSPVWTLNRAGVCNIVNGGYYHRPACSRKKGAWATRPISPEGSRPTLALAGGHAPKFMFLFRLCRLPKHPLGVVIGSLGHQIPGRLGQLASQRLDRNHVARPGHLALKPLPALLDRKS